MNTSWWRTQDDLDPTQKRFILLPAEGRLLLEGPPGSGKTNLLLLRAQYIAARGESNVLVITFTNALADFMRKGVEERGILQPEQIRTYHSWASSHVYDHLGFYPIVDGAEFDKQVRAEMLAHIQSANKKAPGSKQYQAIFVDEAQDLSVDELEALLSLSDKVCVCGDARQGIYNQDGLDIGERLGLERYTLATHYRIGHPIARVADILMPPEPGNLSLEQTSNYNEAVYGESTAKMRECESVDEQFELLLGELRLQVLAFNGDHIGILCARRTTAKDLFERFGDTEFKDDVDIYSGKGTGFGTGKTIHIMTLHSSKGAEFRAVHMFATEELAGQNFRRTSLAYTGVTRAKTALRAYRSGPTTSKLKAAFAESAHVDLSDVFPGAI